MIKKNALLVSIFFLFSFFAPLEKNHIRIYLIGDSTIAEKTTNKYPETGWGMPFLYFFDSTVTVYNRAMNGRSTRTFIEENRWNQINDSLQEGDYVLIQFGHNDAAKDKPERYTTPEQYRINLIRFIDETRSHKAIPVLLTPVARRKFDKNGQVEESHPVYADIVRDVAKEKNVLFIDLDEKSKALLASMGDENSKSLYLQLEPEENPNYPAGVKDNTHFNEVGARKMAQIVWKELKQICPELENHINKNLSKK
jgi:lysophospholipase L1-like esterase